MKPIVRVLLIYPRFRVPTGDPPLGLAYVASSLLAAGSADARIHDATFAPSISAVTDSIHAFDPHIIGIYVDTSMYGEAITVAATARSMGKFVVFGGPHATVMPETLTSHGDIVVTGEGERTMVEIAEHFANRDFSDIPGICRLSGDTVIRTKPRDCLQDIDSIPFPALDLLDMDAYISRWHYLDCLDTGIRGASLVGTRGCPFNCSFCQPALRMLFGAKTRYRSSGNIIAEIQLLKKKYGLNAFFFHDDTITADKTRMLELCEQMRRADLGIRWGCNTRADTIDREMMREMHAAGLRKIHIGAESGCQRILDGIYRKSLTTEQVRETVALAREQGVKSLCFFIMGAPGETWRELATTVNFACSLPIDEASFSILTPLPGTQIRDELLKEGGFDVEKDFSAYNYYSKRVFRDPRLSNLTLKFWQMLALIRFYSGFRRWTYILGHFTSMNGIRKLMRKITRSI